jgi:hypothetical protein
LASRSPQSHAKRAREIAVRERRELKRAKKAAAKLAPEQTEEETTETPAAEEEADSGEAA